MNIVNIHIYNDKKITLIVFIVALCVFISCKTQNYNDKDSEIKNNEKRIQCFLNEESELSTTYKKQNLKKDLGKLYFKDSLIQIENNNFYYVYEIFDNRFLLTSINKKPNIWSSQILIPKDSLYILDLKTLDKSFVSLKKIFFTLNKTELLKTYNRPLILDDAINYFYAVDSIDIVKSKIHLLDPNLKPIQFDLKKINPL